MSNGTFEPGYRGTSLRRRVGSASCRLPTGNPSQQESLSGLRQYQIHHIGISSTYESQFQDISSGNDKPSTKRAAAGGPPLHLAKAASSFLSRLRKLKIAVARWIMRRWLNPRRLAVNSDAAFNKRFRDANDSTREMRRAMIMRLVICAAIAVGVSTSIPAVAQDGTSSAGSTPIDSPNGYVLREHVDRYLVVGDDADALRRSLNARGPVDTDGKRYGGYTRWNIHWEYVSRSDDSGSCAVASFHTVLDVTITLPQWAPSTDSPELLRRQWSTYLAALRAHEDGHQKNAEMAAMSIDHLMQTMQPQSDCDLLDRNLQTTGQQLLQGFKDNDVDYDQRTEHGRTQGAVFP